MIDTTLSLENWDDGHRHLNSLLKRKGFEGEKYLALKVVMQENWNKSILFNWLDWYDADGI